MIEIEHILTVSQLNGYVKAIFAEDEILNDVSVTGEISNFKRHSSGHLYFTLKDDGGAVSCAMFKWQARYLPFAPESGMKVTAHGKITLYEATGQYQLVIASMKAAGTGELYAAYERLKEKLEAEGLFAQERKRPLPPMPQRVGVVTSPTGAAVQDILNILGRRCPMAEVVLCPVLVQGTGAPPEIVRAIELLNEKQACDVIIVGRGGGSIEDLWCFNDEAVARAVAASEIPVISAVGHETDFTICDFAADMRAPTPSAAAELAVPDMTEASEIVENIFTRISYAVRGRIDLEKSRLGALTGRGCFASPMYALETRSQRLDRAVMRISAAESARLAACDARLRACASGLSALDPMRVLARGYSAVFRDGGAVSSAASLSDGDRVTLRFADGEVGAVIEQS